MFQRILILCTFLSLLPILVQGAPTQLKKDFSSVLRSKKISQSFEQTRTMAKSKIQVKTKGELRVVKPHFVNWTIQHPGYSSVTITEKDITIDGIGQKGLKRKEVFKLNDPRVKSGSSNILELKSWFEMDLKRLTKQYTVKSKGKGVYIFYSKPDTNASFKKVAVKVIPGKEIKQIRFFEKTGDLLEFRFTSSKADGV